MRPFKQVTPVLVDGSLIKMLVNVTLSPRDRMRGPHAS